MFDTIKGQLIVSCQALEEEPLYGAETMAKMAKACVQGGAKAIRANGMEDIRAIKKAVDVPVIGIIKRDYPDSEIHITPSEKEIQELLSTDCEIIAMDATFRHRPNGEELADLLQLVHQHKRYAMADISTLEEAISAQALGFDLVATTLSGYTSYSPRLDGPDFKLIKLCVKALHIPLIAEGKITDRLTLKKVLACRPYSVVIGGAITRPQLIAKQFVSVMNDEKKH
jgi:N-acylglucosamine-6-phosphate 2-epimerase